MPNMLILTLIIAQAVISNCGEINFTRTYCEETLVSYLFNPSSLSVDFNFNDLYFTNYENGRQLFKMNMKNKEVFQIPGIDDAFEVAINHEGREVFVGTGHGLYKYNPRTNTSTFVGAKGKYINHMYYKDGLYFSVYPDYDIMTFKNGKFSSFGERGAYLVVDNDDTMYYTSITGFYKQKGTHLVQLMRGFYPLAELTLDPNGDLYGTGYRSLYYFNKKSLQLEKVLDVNKGMGSIAFDKSGRLIYCDDNKIYRLTPRKNVNSC